jgi:hypothetical protein
MIELGKQLRWYAHALFLRLETVTAQLSLSCTPALRLGAMRRVLQEFISQVLPVQIQRAIL